MLNHEQAAKVVAALESIAESLEKLSNPMVRPSTVLPAPFDRNEKVENPDVPDNP